MLLAQVAAGRFVRRDGTLSFGSDDDASDGASRDDDDHGDYGDDDDDDDFKDDEHDDDDDERRHAIITQTQRERRADTHCQRARRCGRDQTAWDSVPSRTRRPL